MCPPKGTKKHVAISGFWDWSAPGAGLAVLPSFTKHLEHHLKAEVWSAVFGSRYVPSTARPLGPVGWQAGAGGNTHVSAPVGPGDEWEPPAESFRAQDHGLVALDASILIVIFISREYSLCPRCRFELLHALELQRRGHCRVVFVTVQKDFTTISHPPIAGWLGSVLAGRVRPMGGAGDEEALGGGSRATSSLAKKGLNNHYSTTWFALWSEAFAEFAAERISIAVGGPSFVPDPANKDLHAAYILPESAALSLTFAQRS